MSAPKDHYLPQFYLRGFADDERLQVFDRERKQFRTQTALNTASERNRYTMILADGTQDRTIEQVVLNRVETASAVAIDKLERRVPLSEWEREALCWLGAFFYSRVPDFENSLNHFSGEMLKDAMQMILSSPARIEEVMLEIDPEWKSSRVTAEDLFKLVHERSYQLRFHRNEYLRSMIKMALDVVRLLVQMDWTILHAPAGEEFITCDSPLVIDYPDEWKLPGFFGVGLIFPGARKYLPLSSSVCLVMGDLVMGDHGGRFAHVDASAADVRRINEAVTWDSYRMVIGGNEQLVRSIVEATGIEAIPPAPGVRIVRIGPYVILARGRPRRPPKEPPQRPPEDPERA